GGGQFILKADHFQAGAVAHVVGRPRFAGCLLIAAKGQDDDIGVGSDLFGFRDFEPVFFGIREDNLILVPASPHRDTASLAVNDFGAAGYLFPDPVEQGGIVVGDAAVTAKHAPVCVRSDDGDLPDPVIQV